MVPAVARPATSDSSNHPVVSSTIPPARISIPSSRLMSPKSSRIFAITGTAEIDSATAMNNAKISRPSGWTR
jgi:hypothetical protein